MTDFKQDLSIPKVFISDASGEVFLNCKVCNRDLMSGDIPYSVEKAKRKMPDKGPDITLFEIAVCMHCAQKQAQKMSKASRLFMEQTLVSEKSKHKKQAMWDGNWQESWDKQCFYDENPIQDNEEYHVVGQFLGGQILNGFPPFVIGYDMLEYINENLSAETKEELDDFGNKYLGTDPKLALLLKDTRVLIV